MEKNAITVSNIHKDFKLPHEVHNSLKNVFVNIFKRRGYEIQSALNGISFEVKEGEFFGIVGRNGSGKSTLLKIIAGIYTPTKGTIKVNGSLVPFIELGVGFNPDLTGRENVFLNGALLGFNRKEMRDMYGDIVEFAELEKFMDQKLKNYSSGMQVRLAFSIAIKARGDILLLDEVLAVGDSAFQQKCFDYFANLKRHNKTVILVTHSMSSVEKYCDRALILESGKILKIGSPSVVASKYEEIFIEDQNKKYIQSVKTDESAWDVDVTTTIVQDEKKAKAIKSFKKFSVAVEFKAKGDYPDVNVGINIRNDEQKIVFAADAKSNGAQVELVSGQKSEIIFEIENRYTNGRYTVDVVFVNEAPGGKKYLYRRSRYPSFMIFGATKHVHSMFLPEFNVKYKKKAK